MKIETHRRNKEKYINGIQSWTIPTIEKKKVVEFVQEYLSGRITNKIGSNSGALVEKLIPALALAQDYYLQGMDMDSVKTLKKEEEKLLLLEKIKSEFKKEVSRFVDDLVVDKKIKSKLGKPYPPKSQKEIMNYHKRYLLWRYKDNDLVSPLAVTIETKERDIESLTLAEVEKLYRACKSDEERYLIAGFFSTGARAEEFLSLRMCDYG